MKKPARVMETTRQTHAGTNETVGVLRVDKTEGPTSHDAVAAVRRALNMRRVGHTGTLDPFASGLLLICVGRATRLAEDLSALPKTYVARARLGEVTDTDDRTGETVERTEGWRELTTDCIEAALREQRGSRMQVPPVYSAKRIGGERLYRRARRGEAVEPKPVPVVIERLTVREIDLPDVEFEVECSSGTYVRAIARDLGRSVGVGAHLHALRRTRIGSHDVADAVRPDRLDDRRAVAAAMLTRRDALPELPLVAVGEAEARRISHGSAVRAPDGTDAGRVRVVFRDRLIAVAEAGRGRLQPRKVFARD